MKKLLDAGLPAFVQEYIFALPLQVRDYEVDYQGIVNNANYLHYMEHTRHEFCRRAGLSFEAMHRRGIDPVLAKAQITYRSPLHMGDSFISCLRLQRRGATFNFVQDMYLPDGTPVVKALITVACIEDGRLTRGDVLARAFADFL